MIKWVLRFLILCHRKKRHHSPSEIGIFFGGVKAVFHLSPSFSDKGTLNRWFMPVYSPKYGSNRF
jgi:hypothetical protein